MTPDPWKPEGEGTEHDFRIFRIRNVTARSPRTGKVHPFTILECPDWVNVVARTTEGRLLMIRQFRHGTGTVTLEIPGGMVDPGEAPAEAAARELREETGYAGGTPQLLGIVEPNPAIQTNLCHLYWVDGCRRVGEQRPDDGEDIEVLTMSPEEAHAAVKDGRIRHALVICALRSFAERD